ncbi:MAG: FCD domain-containing protein [Aeromicrobium sp.]
MGSDRSRETLRRLRENITSGRWPLNSKIPTEPELMAELGVGRSTVREAVRSLSTLGMLEPARSRGTFVRSRNPVSVVLSDFVTHHSVVDILAVRRAFEIEACQLAAVHRTDDDLRRLSDAHERDIADDPSQTIERGRNPGQFHALMLESTQNTLLVDLYNGIMAGIRAAIEDGTIVSGSDAVMRQHDHQAMLDAIADRDPARAGVAAAEHAARDLVPAPDLGDAPTDS